MKKRDKDFQNFLNQINYGYSLFNQKHKSDLDEKGYAVIEADKNYWDKNGINFDNLIKITDNLCNKEGQNGGWENRLSKNDLAELNAQRISNLSNKNEIFIKISQIPDILNAANYVIKKPFKISSLQIRNPFPFGNAQELHIDWRPRLFNYYNYNQFSCFIYLDDADQQNGALHVYPGTHKLTGEPCKEYIKKNNLLPNIVEVKKYNIILQNIYAWHYGGKNHNGKSRKTIFLNYRERSEWQQLNQKKYLDNNVKEKMNEFEKYLYAIRSEDKFDSEWVYKNRNNFFFKTFNKIRDIFYHKFII